MSRRPRAPLALKPLRRAPTHQLAMGFAPPATRSLPAPDGPARRLELAPDCPTRVGTLDDGSVELAELDVRPAVDVVPATLTTAVYALRSEACQVEIGETCEVETLSSVRGGRVAVLPPAESQRSLPDAVLTARPKGRAARDLDPEVLRRCLTSLFHSSGATSPGDLALLGIYERVPAGAIEGVAMTERGVQLRLRAKARARAGMLVVGRLRSSGGLVTTEVALDGNRIEIPQGRRRLSREISAKASRGSAD